MDETSGKNSSEIISEKNFRTTKKMGGDDLESIKMEDNCVNMQIIEIM